MARNCTWSARTRQTIAGLSLLATGLLVALTLSVARSSPETDRLAWIASLDPAASAPIELVLQQEDTDCGVAALKMVLDHYGLTEETLSDLKAATETGTNGTNLLTLKKIAEDHGLETHGLRLPFARLADVSMPLIAHVHRDHFVVVRSVGDHVVVDDPAIGRLRMSPSVFERAWDGVVLSFDSTLGLD